MKSTVIKAIEIRDARFPELFAIVKALQERDEDISKIIRGLLLREYLHEMLFVSGASAEQILLAISALRRSLNITLLELDLTELRCKKLLGLDGTADLQPNSLAHAANPFHATTESIEDSW